MEELNYRKSASLQLKNLEERYDNDQNPVWLMDAFIMAHKYGLSIPKWVRDKLNQVFQDFVADPKASLDTLMGCKKGRGQAPARADVAKRGRDVLLATAVDVLRRHTNMSVSEAVEIAHSYCRFLSQRQPGDNQYDERVEPPPSVEEVRQIYYAVKRSLKLDEIVFYPEHFIEAILRHAPDEVRKK
jgi:hypothetical protein